MAPGDGASLERIVPSSLTARVTPALAASRAFVPRGLRRRLRLLVWLARTPRLAADASTRQALRRLLADAGRAGASTREVVELRLSPLGSHPFGVRRGTSDAEVVCETFLEGYHLPPE